MAPTKDAQRLRRLAERKGRAEDQFQLALLFYDGREGLKPDKVAAAKWFRKAAAQEHARAQAAIGGCYAIGEGVEQNPALAVEWTEKAAGQGEVQALHNLGLFYHGGQGVEQNDALAVEWWEKAAMEGNAASQYNLGRAGPTHTAGTAFP